MWLFDKYIIRVILNFSYFINFLKKPNLFRNMRHF